MYLFRYFRNDEVVYMIVKLGKEIFLIKLDIKFVIMFYFIFLVDFKFLCFYIRSDFLYND